MALSKDARVLYNMVTLAHNHQLVPLTQGSTHSFAKIWLTWIKNGSTSYLLMEPQA